MTINPDSADYITAWVDWNQDLDFDDAGEEFVVADEYRQRGPPHGFGGAAPADAVVGDTRMRVSLVYNQTPDPSGRASSRSARSRTTPSRSLLPMRPR